MTTQTAQQAQQAQQALPESPAAAELSPYELLTAARTALDLSLDAANGASVAAASASKRVEQIQEDLAGARTAHTDAEQSISDSHTLIHGSLDATEAAIRKLRIAYPL